jgi:hypothetical protein
VRKVAFIFADGVPAWNGGVNYYNNLIRILKESMQYEPIIFCSPRISNACKEKFPDVNIIECKAISRPYLCAYIRKIIFYLLGRNCFLDYYLKKENIKIVSHNEISLDKKSKFPSCGWIPDFQCMHYPKYFSKKSIGRNKYNYSYLAKYSTRIIVSSSSCEKDLVALLGKSIKNKTEIFNFCLPPLDSGNEYCFDLIAKYNIEAYKYYVVSNQFWQHKNHIVILNALKYIMNAGIEIPFRIISTGLINDPRDPTASKILKEYLNINKLGSYFIMTDIIPYEDVLALQYYSIAIIQPSLFEGWNTAVEECKRIGKKIILSNIDVHIEQSPENVVFFDPTNANELANVLLNVYYKYDIINEQKLRYSALSNQNKTWQKFSNDYCNLLDKTIKEGESKYNG